MTRALRGPAEQGLTLIELLVTVVVMGIAFLVIVGGLGMAIIASDIQSRQATAQTLARSAAEEVKGDDVAYVDCATEYPQPAVDGHLFTVFVVGYWVPGGDQYLGSCPTTDGGVAVDAGLQLVEVTVTSPARAVAESIQVVKRRP